ncbi:MAG: hypothetical protein AAB613_01570 [Patescibacteria group bacterium]
MKDLPLGTVSLKGRLLLGVINDDLIERWKAIGELETDFDFAPVVAFSNADGHDYTDLAKTIGLNEAIVCHRASADLRNATHPADFVRICHQLGLNPQRSRIFISPDGSDCAKLVGRLTKEDAIELGSFSYDGNLTVELHESYQCMEAKENASNKKGKGAYAA